MADIVWLDDPEDHDYKAARDFLDLLMDDEDAMLAVGRLRRAETVARWKAKDILRAVGPDSNPTCALLPKSSAGVQRKLRKIHDGTPLSPVLLVRDLVRHTLLIADGDHRVSAAYWTDEDSIVPCRITDWE